MFSAIFWYSMPWNWSQKAEEGSENVKQITKCYENAQTSKNLDIYILQLLSQTKIIRLSDRRLSPSRGLFNI